MSGTVDFKRVLLAAMAAAALLVVLAIPHQAKAATDCSAAGSDPTAAQYCPPTEPEEECNENGSGANSGNGSNSGSSEECRETSAAATSSPSSPSGTAAAEGGTLPFTGSDVPALLAIAAALIAGGLGIRRLSRQGAEQI